MDINIATFNVRGLNDKMKMNRVITSLEHLKLDVIMLQETHYDSDKKAKFMGDLWGGKIVWGFGPIRSAGVGIFFKPNLPVQVITSRTDSAGRIVAVHVSIGGIEYNFISVYAPVDHNERSGVLDKIASFCVNNVYNIVAGDFNCINDPVYDYSGMRVDHSQQMKGSKVINGLCETFDLLDVYKAMHPTRPAYTCVSWQSCSRIDRVYMSRSLADWVVRAGTVPVSYSDHVIVCYELRQSAEAHGRGLWKCNTTIFNDINVIGDIRSLAKIAMLANPKNGEWWENLKQSFKDTLQIHSCRLAKIRRQLRAECENKLRLAINTANTAEIRILKVDLEEQENYIAQGAALRVKIQVLNNEIPSIVSKQNEKFKAKRKTITELQTAQGVIKDTPSILKECKIFYSVLLRSEPIDCALIDYFTEGLPKLAEEKRALCEGPITFDECLIAIKGMQGGKTPGCDGLPKEFYETFFHMFGHGYVEAMNHCLEQGLLPLSQRLATITLLCKDSNKAHSLNSWRPISLLNVDYKIISKILANRLKRVVNDIIHVDQTCAIPGRSIHDNLHLLRDIVQYADSKNLPAAFLSLDQEKAFDRIEHVFLFKVLEAFGFGGNFTKWIKLCYTSVCSQVVINGYLTDIFDVTRSIRQGCCMSSLLYVLCIEPFAHRVRLDRHVVGVQLPGVDREARIAIYADDATAIVCDEKSIRKIFLLSELYGLASGARLNKAKCKGVLLGSLKNSLSFYNDFTWSDAPIKICGVYFYNNDTTEYNWNQIQQKIQLQKQEVWCRNFTFQGKAAFLNMYILSKIWFIAKVFQMSKAFHVFINAYIRQFMWNNKPPLLSGKTLSAPTSVGGIDLVEVQTKSQAFAVRHVYDFVLLAVKLQLSQSDCMAVPAWFYFTRYWISMRIKRFWPCVYIVNVPNAEDPSIFYKHCLFSLTKLRSAGLTLDLNDSTKKVYYQLLNLIEVSSRKPVTVNNVAPDWSALEVKTVSPKARDLSWRLGHNILPLAAKLYALNVYSSPECSFCSEPFETVKHLFVECWMASKLWRAMSRLCVVGFEVTGNFNIGPAEILLNRIQNVPAISNNRDVFLVLLTEMKGIIWSQRCCRRFDNEFLNAKQIWSVFCNKIKQRKSLDFKRFKKKHFDNTWGKVPKLIETIMS